MRKIFITGGAGYVGSVLTPYLLKKGYEISVFDLMIYGNTLDPHKNLNIIKGDIRDYRLLEKNIPGHDAIIHLACISNDPSFELNPVLGRMINLDSFEPLVRIARNSKIKHFIYASSSSVYGVKNEPNVTEDMLLEPLTDYSKFKALCEDILLKYKSDEFIVTILRPATVCGYSPRQRLDLVVNILSNYAYHKKEILVLGGDQLRPNIHIKDMVRAYELILNSEFKKVNGEVFNVGFENKTVNELAFEVKRIIGKDVVIKKFSSNDNRSYHISSEKILKNLNFKSEYSIADSITDLKNAFSKKLLTNCLENENYFNIKKMNSINLK
jgi:nucleoside-diphosphate-sugar epimerase